MQELAPGVTSDPDVMSADEPILICKLCGDTFEDHFTLGNRKVCYNKDRSKMAIITGNYFTP